VTTPVEETLIPPVDPGGAVVVVKRTAPVLPVVVSVSVNDELLVGVVEFENGAVWMIVVWVGGGVTTAALTATEPVPLELP
jgi:hypothetical protein